MIKKTDMVLIAFFVVIAISFNFILFHIQKRMDEDSLPKVIVEVDGNVFQVVDMTAEGIYELTDGNFQNTMEIKDGMVKMLSSNCRDQLCVHQKPIRYSLETIVCLPNRLVIGIENQKSNQADEIDQVSY